VYSFVSLFVCLDTYLLAGSSSRQKGKQAVTEGRKEGRKEALLACLLMRQLLSTEKLVTPLAATVKMACLPNLGCAKKRWVQ
jgi:hypothetical protein